MTHGTPLGGPNRSQPSDTPALSQSSPGAGGLHSHPQPGSQIALVDPAQFLLATRDAGYRSPTHSIAEFVDNAVQAGATNITINLIKPPSPQASPEVLVVDDGAGMDPETLHSALTFGGSSRFNDRQSLGRYGMGLPNGALSIARRVDVYSWQGEAVYSSSLDIDAFLSGGARHLGPITTGHRPAFLPSTIQGTAIHLSRCDQLGYKRIGFLRRRLVHELGRIHRNFLDEDVTIHVDETQVIPVDPLFLMPAAMLSGANQFGDTLKYTFPASRCTGHISIRFSELPVESWSGWPNTEKRRLGITNTDIVSVLRGGREIDSGWMFMGDKRRENYDDWWRCQIAFSPELDELFGVTHTKQGIRPSEDLVATLSKDLEPIAHALSKRVRERFEAAKAATVLTLAEQQATRASGALPPLPHRCDDLPSHLRGMFYLGEGQSPEGRYRIRIVDLKNTSAFETILRDGYVLVLINRRHPFYRDLYAPLANAHPKGEAAYAHYLALMVLAASHAEVAVDADRDRQTIKSFRRHSDDVLATFLNA